VKEYLACNIRVLSVSEEGLGQTPMSLFVPLLEFNRQWLWSASKSRENLRQAQLQKEEATREAMRPRLNNRQRAELELVYMETRALADELKAKRGKQSGSSVGQAG
jgi:hypothetical protein